MNHFVQHELSWLRVNLDLALAEIAEKGSLQSGIDLESAPSVADSDDAYSSFIVEHNLNDYERLFLAMCLSRYYLDFWKILYIDGNPFGIFLENDFAYPTPTTFLALVCGKDIEKRLAQAHIFKDDHLFFKRHVVSYDQKEPSADKMASRLSVAINFQELFFWNAFQKPGYSAEFPAEELNTRLNWEDLILEEHAQQKLEEIAGWLEHNNKLTNVFNQSGHLKPGYRCLFYGPSGTGKTLAASLLGKRFNLPVFRIDLSHLISKYIGETSKNLKRVFDLAEDKNWILFFDEGDAIFGKRVDTSESSNKNAAYVNQDIAFLLQRIEKFNGLVIVATNLRNNMDDAFSRRFENTVHFKLPSSARLEEIWNNYLPDFIEINRRQELQLIFKQNKLSLASMYNVIHRLTLLSIAQDKKVFSFEEVSRLVADERIK